MIRFKTKIALAMHDMTQKDLSDVTGIRLPTISGLCTGTAKHIPVDVLDKICSTLRCQPADLMEYVEIPSEKSGFQSVHVSDDFTDMLPGLLEALQDYLRKQKHS